MQYRYLKNLIAEGTDGKGGRTVTMPEDLFRKLLVAALRSKAVLDEQFYLAINADIRDAVEKKSVQSASDHYYHTGYFENRMPKKIVVDERYYLEQNPDVANAIRKGVIKSAQEHFEYAGFREGRLPFRDFSMF